MLPGKAINASNAKVYINGYWVDDFVSMKFEYQNGKVPFRGYHQKFWTAVADGKVGVQGNMALNFRYPGYLLAAISAVNGVDAAISTKFNMSRARLYELINKIRTASPQERVELLSSAPPESFNLMSELMELTLLGGVDEALGSNPVELGPNDSWAGREGFNMDIVYGDEQNSFAERISGVHLVLQGRTITNSAAEGAEPLYDGYAFFGKKIVTNLKRGDLDLKILADSSGVQSIGSLI